MNTNTNPTQVSDAIRRAANTFVLVDFSITGGTMMRQISKAKQNLIIADLAHNPEVNAEGVNFSVHLLGSWHKEFKRRVADPAKEVRKYIDFEKTAVFAETGTGQTRRSGPRMVKVNKFAEFNARAHELIEEFKRQKALFLPHYETYCEEGKLQIDAKFAGYDVTSTLRYPSLAEFDDAFHVFLGSPRPIPLTTAAQYNFPAELLDQITASEVELLAGKMEGAKEELIVATGEFAKRINDAFSKDSPKVYETVISEAKRLVEGMRDLFDGYDRDSRFDDAANALERIARVSDAAVFRHSTIERQAAIEAVNITNEIFESAPVRNDADNVIITPEMSDFFV